MKIENRKNNLDGKFVDDWESLANFLGRLKFQKFISIKGDSLSN
jgi:hypothetical protein